MIEGEDNYMPRLRKHQERSMKRQTKIGNTKILLSMKTRN